MSSLSGKQGPRYRHEAEVSEPYETIAVEKLTPIIGAEISGVDIGKLVDDEAPSNRQMDEIHRALAENLVIFFRDQHITPQQHLAFGRKFGELHIHPAAPHEAEDPALMQIFDPANIGAFFTQFKADMQQPSFWLAVGKIIWINVLLSGDNALVIAMACRGLHGAHRLWGMIIGAGIAVRPSR